MKTVDPFDIRVADWFLKKVKNYKVKRSLQVEKTNNDKWNKLFSGKDFIIHTLNDGLLIKLYKDSDFSREIYDGFEISDLQFMQKILKHGDFFIDAGANIGLFSLFASKLVGKNGKVFSFEPTAITYKRFLENCALNNIENIQAENIGLSENDGQLFLNISENGLDAWNTFASQSHIQFRKGENVPVKKLDNYIKEKAIDFSKIKFIKIDVEGWEIPVIKGAKDLLLANDKIVLMVEFTQKNSIAAGFDCYKLYDEVTALGYQWFFYHAEQNILTPDKKRTQYPYFNLIAAKDVEALNKFVPVKNI